MRVSLKASFAEARRAGSGLRAEHHLELTFFAFQPI